MACYHPISGYITKGTSKSFTINRPKNGMYFAQTITCGQCIGCRLERSRQWAMRCIHEAQLHQQNCFITLTYNNEHLPKNQSLNKRHFQLFMKKLRKSNNGKIRYFHCGEYGEQLGRPHYHACLFNYTPQDQMLLKEAGGIKLYTSESLSKIWGKGFVTIGEVTFESAAYVARYITKKITGSKSQSHYGDLQPEYTTMSRRPGIGKQWLTKFTTDVYPSDEIIIRTKQVKPPKYYDKELAKTDPSMYQNIKAKRIVKGKENALDNTPERLQVKETIKLHHFNQLKRSYEHE